MKMDEGILDTRIDEIEKPFIKASAKTWLTEYRAKLELGDYDA